MKIHFPMALKIGVLSIFWLIFPPLFLTFSIIWKMTKLVGRVVLTAVAPLTIVSLIVGVFTRIYWNIGENGNLRFTHLDFADDDDQTIELMLFMNFEIDFQMSG